VPAPDGHGLAIAESGIDKVGFATIREIPWQHLPGGGVLVVWQWLDARRPQMAKIDESPEPIELNISDEKLGFLILKAREFDAKVAPVDPDPGSNPTDDHERAILEDQEADRTEGELRDALRELNEDETIDVIALLWIGRGDFGREEWDEARRLAVERHRHDSTGYLLGTPTLADELEEGIEAVGHSIAGVEADHL
jgi:hypothetical protein